PASMAVDGVINSSNFNHTGYELQPWWQVDLGNTFTVSSIQITNRTGCTPCAGRTKRFRVFVSASPIASFNTGGSVYEYNSTGLTDGQVITINGLNNNGRYVKVWADNGSINLPLHLAEVTVMGCSSASSCQNNQNPIVSWPVNTPTSYVRNSIINLTSNATDNDGSISKVEFFNGAILLATDNSAPYTLSINPASSSSYAIKAKAYDDCNGTSTSSILNISTTVSCSDGVQNGNETGIDCGGSCTACSLVCPSPINISQGKSASQSSNFNGANSYPASMAVDGVVNSSNFNHTGYELQPWWQVDLGNTFTVSSIQITNRTGCSACAGRTKHFRVFVSASPIASFNTGGSVYEYNSTGLTDGQVITINGLNNNGRYVRVWADNGSSNQPLHLAEVAVMGCSSTTSCQNNQNPIVTWPVNTPTTYVRNSIINITSNATDNDGSISKVEFFNGTNLLATDNIAPYTLSIDPASSASYAIKAIAYDDCNGITTSSVLNISTTVSCSDGFQNGSETGIDCGGSCTACNLACPSPTNISQGKTASQSSNYNVPNSYPASNAVDGIINSSDFNHTGYEFQPWWQVDLGNTFTVSSIQITNRTGCTPCAGRTKHFRVFVSASPITSFNTGGFVYEYNSTGLTDGQVITINGLNNTGRYVKVWADNGSVGLPLHLAEVSVMGCASTAPDFFNNGNDFQISFWPNPVSDKFNFQVLSLENEGVLQLLDLRGVPVLQQKITTKNSVIQMDELPSGIYIGYFVEKSKVFNFKILKSNP
ncbi:MAG: discoidin domain-containing protein, partial [Saprospiraceae bacterium]